MIKIVAVVVIMVLVLALLLVLSLVFSWLSLQSITFDDVVNRELEKLGFGPSSPINTL